MGEEPQQNKHAVDHFIDLHEQVLKAWHDQKHAAEQAMRQPAAVAEIHYWLVVLGSYALGIVSIVPLLMQRLLDWGVPTRPIGMPFVSALFIWTLILTPLSGWIRGRKRTWLLLIYTLLGVPLILALIDAALQGHFAQFGQNFIPATGLSLILLFFMFGTVMIVSSFMTEPLLLAATSLRSGQKGRVFPSYETGLRDMVMHLNPMLKTLQDHEIAQVAMIAQQKQAGINGRLQTLALASSSFALLGLAALVATQDSVAKAINLLTQSFSAMLGPTAKESPALSGVLIFLLILGLLVAGVLIYTFYTYRELRVLDVISITCALCQADHTPSEPSLPASRSPRLLPTATPPAEINHQPLLLFTFLVGLALVRRIVRR